MQKSSALVLSSRSTLADLPNHDIAIDKNSMGESVEEAFQKNPELPGIIILEGKKLLGMISRQRFMELMNQPFRHDLYYKRPIIQILKYSFDGPLCIDASERIDVAAGMALERPTERLYEPLVVYFSQTGNYCLVDIQVLLHSLSQILAIQNDELRRAQDRLIQSERMALLGQLVAGVAHEINTPVGICLTAASHFQEKVEEIAELYNAGKLKKNELQAFLADSQETSALIFSNITRAAELIQGFKQVAVDQTSQKRRRFNLCEVIQHTLMSLKPKLKHSRQEISVECPKEIEMDSYPGQLSQIITNLVLNALTHAFGEEEPGHIFIRASKIGSEVELSLGDDGRGIPENNLKHIFEPFFSTRHGQGGSGLGLHIVYNLVGNNLAGSIRCESGIGRGTRFTMKFPATSPNCA
jgi:signal transduction histidine kinase